MRFGYHTEPIRAALILVAMLVIAALLIPSGLLRILALALAVGPGAWAILQRRRRRAQVYLTDELLVIENALNGRAKPANKGVALTDTRPESHCRPKQRLVVAPPIDDADNLIRALEKHLQRIPPTVEPISEQELRQWMRRKRIRDVVVLIVGVLATPLYVIIIGRVIASFINVPGVSNVR